MKIWKNVEQAFALSRPIDLELVEILSIYLEVVRMDTSFSGLWDLCCSIVHGWHANPRVESSLKVKLLRWKPLAILTKSMPIIPGSFPAPDDPHHRGWGWTGGCNGGLGEDERVNAK
jgi:hypothetical protein